MALGTDSIRGREELELAGRDFPGLAGCGQRAERRALASQIALCSLHQGLWKEWLGVIGAEIDFSEA